MERMMIVVLKKPLCYFSLLFLLVVTIVVLIAPTSIYALPDQSTDPAPKLTGYCGDTTKQGTDPDGHNAYYECTDENLDGVYDTLRINGTGRMGYLQKENEYLERYFFYEHPKNIETVYIDGVTNVADMSSSHAEKFVLSDTVTTIDSSAFSSADITELIASNVKEIGEKAFQRSKIKKININKAVKIGDYAFEDCKDLVKVTIGKKVKVLGQSCFTGCTALTSIKIPSNVETIGINAFSDCTNLSEISLAEGIQTILGGAFSGCTSLKSIKLPQSLKTLGHAFRGNDDLTELSIPGGVDIESKIGTYLVSDCRNLRKLKLGEGITKASLIASNCPKLNEVYYPSTLIKSNIAKSIVNCPLLKTAGPGKGYNINYAWKNEIPEWAFYELDSLECVTFGGTIKTIGKRACYNCTNLTTVNLGESVETIKEEAFELDINLALINFSKKGNLTTIESRAFKDCEAILSIHLPKSVKKLSGGAFYGCSELNDVMIYSDDINMEGGPFTICPELKTAGPSGDGKKYNVTFVNLKKIPGSVLSGNEFLEKVVIPKTVTEIGPQAFFKCTSLSEVVMSESVRIIGRGAFESCIELKEFNIPKKIEIVDSYAFANCNKIRSLTFPITLTEFDATAAPAGCVIYGYDNSPSDIRSFGRAYVSKGKACAVYFVDNHNGNRIKRYVLLNQKVGKAPVPEITLEGAKFQCWAYDDKTAFSPNFNVGKSTNISFYAKYYINGVPEFDPKAKVKEELLSGYSVTIDNCRYKLSEITSDDKICLVLLGCDSNASTIVIKDSVKINGLSCKITEINSYAFSNCKNMKNLTIGKNIKKIGSNAFYACESLKKISIKTNKLTINNVENNVFGSLDKNTAITVPKSLYKIYKKILVEKGYIGKIKKG